MQHAFETVISLVLDLTSLWAQPVQKLLLQVPRCASVAVPAYSFPEKFSSFSFLSLLTKAEVIAALVKVRAECNKVNSLKHT
jgi:hypothetical protein